MSTGMGANRRDASMPAVMAGYLRVSTDDQDVDGQRAPIERYCHDHNVEVRWYVERASAKTLERPQLQLALAELAPPAPSLDGLIVAKLDRLSRSVHDATGLFALAAAQDWPLVSLSPQVDMTTPYGRAMAQMAAVFAELERELISQRTREALAAKRAAGVRIGRPVSCPPEVEARIAELYRDHGLGPGAIARILEAGGVTAPHGGSRWHRNSIGRILDRLARGGRL